MIIFIQDNGKTNVVKVFKDKKQYILEHKNITKDVNWSQRIDDMKQKCKCKLPIIVKSAGGEIIEDKSVLVMEKAPGRSLKEYIYKLPTMGEAEIIHVFSNIGRQIGELDKMMSKINSIG